MLTSPPRRRCRNRCRVIPCRAVVGALLAAAFIDCSFVLPASNAAAETARVLLGTDTGMPGGPAVIPLVLVNPQGIQARKLTMVVEIPSDLLQLKAARISLATEMAGGKIQTQEGSLSEDKKITAIRLTLSGEKPLPSGTLASLELRIAEEVGDRRQIPLNVKSVDLTAWDGQRVENVGREDGQVTVSKAPPTLVNCFFFSH